MNKSGSFNIVVDAMGGDYAPDEIIKGSIEGSEAYELKLTLTGDKNRIRQSAEKNNLNIENINIIHAPDIASMDDSPSEVLKYKKNSSIYIGTEIAAKINNCAFLSAGNTGAAMACSLFNMRKIENIARPAIAVVIPLYDKKFLLIDAGANLEVKPLYLKQFAIMGKVYCNEVLKIKNPRIGLLNVGSEEKKGTDTIIESHNLLKNSNLNFIGNVEGRDIFEGKADVVVCDGFIGNILLKSVEGMSGFFFNEIKSLLKANFITKISALLLNKYFIGMKKKFDYEEYGGALLLGVNGVSIISHGSSKTKAIKNAIKLASESLRGGIVKKISEEILSQ